MCCNFPAIKHSYLKIFQPSMDLSSIGLKAKLHLEMKKAMPLTSMINSGATQIGRKIEYMNS